MDTLDTLENVLRNTINTKNLLYLRNLSNKLKPKYKIYLVKDINEFINVPYIYFILKNSKLVYNNKNFIINGNDVYVINNDNYKDSLKELLIFLYNNTYKLKFGNFMYHREYKTLDDFKKVIEEYIENNIMKIIFNLQFNNVRYNKNKKEITVYGPFFPKYITREKNNIIEREIPFRCTSKVLKFIIKTDKNYSLIDMNIQGTHINSDDSGAFCIGNYRNEIINYSLVKYIYKALMTYNLNDFYDHVIRKDKFSMLRKYLKDNNIGY